MLLYELVSGHPPFYPDLTPERVRHEVPAPPGGRPSPPEALRTLVARCLAKAPADRPASMREVHAELERCLTLETPIEPVAVGTPASRHGRRPTRCRSARNGSARRRRRRPRTTCAAKDSGEAC